MKLQIKNILKYSFVISIDNKRLDVFFKNFNEQKINPLPQKYDGFYNVDFINQTNIENKAFVNLLLTTISIVKMAKQLNWPYICIFEDDAYPCINCIKKLEIQLHDVPDNANAIILGWKYIHKNIDNIKLSNRMLESNNYFYGSHAYILFNKAYDSYLKQLTQFTMPIDMQLSALKYVYMCEKPLFIQYSKEISIINHSIGYEYDRHIYKNKNDLFKDFKKSNDDINIISSKYGGNLGNIVQYIYTLFFYCKQHNISYDYIKLSNNSIIENNYPLFIKMKDKICNNDFINQFEEYQLLYNDACNKKYTKIIFASCARCCGIEDIELFGELFFNAEVFKSTINKTKIKNFNNTLGISIRRGDFNNPDVAIWSGGYKTLDYIYNLIDLKYNNQLLIVSSDDIDWCKSNITKYNKIIFLSNDEYKPYELFYILANCDDVILSHYTDNYFKTITNNKCNIDLLKTVKPAWDGLNFSTSSFQTILLILNQYIKYYNLFIR